ncbi:hypothetical protein QVD17_02227 [Tagetes erecta]|uniref:Uncharacterized protein n=1 Tax=Tagetes erecta TaxID=13708 RepID=A0AAD8L7U8_TARER|nr:hypothetical protein QVD17_02227 [Tagetes erecta]
MDSPHFTSPRKIDLKFFYLCYDAWLVCLLSCKSIPYIHALHIFLPQTAISHLVNSYLHSIISKGGWVI